MTGTFRVNAVVPKIARPKFGKPSYTVYDVFLAKPEGGVWVHIVSTKDPFQASLCNEAQKHGTLLDIGAKDSRYGQDLVTVEFHQAVAS
jgi:hypothetical protein